MKTLALFLALCTAAVAQTAIDSMLTLKNVSPVAPGTQATAAILNNGMLGSGVTWSFNSGTASTITVGPHQSACNIDGPVSIGGTVYTPATPSQTFAYNTNNSFTTYFADLPSGHRSVTLNFCIVTNSPVNNLYDIIGAYDSQGHYAYTQQRLHSQDSLCPSNCLNIETDGSGTLHSLGIPITIGNSYNCDFNVNETTGIAKLACYQPTYPYTQLACTQITVPSGGNNQAGCDVNGTVQIQMQTGRDPSRLRVGNNEVGVANATTYIENLMFDWTNGAFPLGVRTQYAPWAGILSPTRAIDWRNAGVVGGIPVRPRCTTGTGTVLLPASSTSTQINTALTGCDNGHAVELAAGTFNGLGMLIMPSLKTLRGQGADQTHLNFSSGSGCTGQLTLICFAGDNTDKVNPRNLTNLTGNFFPGSNALTFATVTNLKVANPLIIDQADDTTDAGGVVISDTSSSMGSVAPGVTGPRSLEGNGGGSQRSGRQQQQEVTVVSCGAVNTPGASCSGTNVLVTFSPGLYMPNWDISKSPQAWWSPTPHEGGGVEDLSIDSGSDTNSAMVFKFLNTKNTYISGVRSNAAYRAHVQMQFASHATIQNSYFFLNQGGGPTNYGIECYGGSDILIVNNIFQAVTGPIPLNSACEGNVIAYNYFTNIYYSSSAGWNNPFANEHTAGAEFNLIEGNVGDGWDADVFHGTHHFDSFFRNRFIGTQPVCQVSGSPYNGPYSGATYGPCNNNRFALQLRSWSRFHNVVGNVLGTSLINTTYASTAGDHNVYTLNNGNTGGNNCPPTCITVPDDPNVTTTLLRWGNWDVVSNATRFVSGEIPNAPTDTVQTPFSNFQPTVGNVGQPAFPASAYFTAKPSFFAAAKPWPPIGPDVSGGNIAGVAGHAYTIPAQDCATSIGIPADGTGAIHTFNASICYSGAPGTPAISLSPTSLAFGTFAIGVTSPGRLITVTNTGSATLNITSISASIEYAQTTTCGASLGAGLACTITVTFTPLGVGLRNGAITIVDNASGSPHTVALSGTGTGTGIQFFGNLTITGNALFTTQVNNVPGMSISPGSLAFGSLALGGIATLPITITSTGNSQLVFTSIILADSVNYSQTNNCTVIVPTASCTINVTFSPQSIAALNTSLTIIANDSGSPHVVTITGTGIAAGGDLPLPTFTPTALSLPQAFVDPMAPFSQTVQATVYIGNTTCPTAPLRTNYKGVSVPATVCDFADANGAGLQSNLNDWCSFSFGGDQRWDVIVTKGTSFDFSASPWLWCDKYNGTPTQKYIVFHSDTPNPRGRQVCSHGVQDLLVPPLPDMGQRNHGCTGLLGLPAVSVPMPVTNAAYTSDSSYNDLANMWTLTASGPIIQMGAASTLGDPFNDCGIPSGAGACPTDGVNHIVIQDARIMPAPSLTTTVIVAQVKAAEWTNAGGILIAHFLPAAPHDIGFDEDYFTADADDDGFGNNKITDALQMACATCWFAHNYADGIKRDGSEDHVINTANSPGPVLVSHNWMEGGAIAFWGGQAETPLVTGLLNSNTERRRNRMTYNPRWLPSPGGLQALSKKISGGSCSGGNVLVLNIPNTGAKVITNLVVYLKGVTGVGAITNQWYTAASVTSTAASLTIPCTNGTVSAAGNVFGFATGINITSAAAMNGKAVKDPTNNNPVSKNRSESKSGVRTLADGEICENSGADGQDGSCYVISSRAYSGSSWGTGGENKEISDWVLTNSIVRNSNNSISIGSRSGSQIIGQFTGVTSIVCAASGNTAAITAAGLNGGSGILDPPNTQTATGTDIYLTDIGNGVISGTPLLANGFYATAYPTGGNYNNDAVVTVTGTAICPASDTTTAGTVYAPTGGNGVGVNTPGHRYVFQNLLIYNIGDHGAWNGGGSVSVAQIGSGLNNWAVNMTVTQVSPVTIVNAAVTAISVCPASQACPKVVQATVGDLAYVQCLNDPRFSSSLPNAKGARMLSVAGNQLSFTYTPQNGSPALSLSDTTTCGLQTPDSSADSGYYGFQSFPWPFYWNHITGVGVNSFWLSPGGQGSYIKTATYANSFQLQPGVADIAPANLLTTGGVHCNNSETYSPTDTGGITFCNDRTGLTFQRYVMSTRSIANFPNFLAGVICGSPPCTQDPVLNPGTNSTPVRVSTPGSSVTCGGVACDATHFIPDSIGFSGAMVTSNYPLTLPDFRNYSLDSSSPYKAGGILQGMDGKDVGVQMSILLNAQNRTLYVCGLPCGAGPFRDGPRYGFLVWNASTDPSHVNYRIYRNGAVSPTATVTNAYFSDYGLPSGVNSWVVKDWNGTIETSVSGLTTTVY